MSSRLLRIAVGLGVAALSAALVAATLLVLWRLEAGVKTAAADTVQRAARAAEATVNRQFLAVDGMLAGLPPLLGSLTDPEPVDPAAVSRVLRDLTFQNFNFRNLLLVQPNGAVWAAGLPDSRRRPLPVATEALVTAARSGTVAIAGPVHSATTGEWTLFFAREATFGAAGRLLAVAEVPVPQIATMLASIGDAPGQRITVERRDGTLLASLPHDEGAIGRSLPTPMPESWADGSPHAGLARLTPVPATLAARLTLYRDILVTVGWDDAAIAAEIAADRERLLIGAGAAELLLLALGFALDMALRQRERGEAERAQARAVLENALGALPDGLVMFDAGDRLVISNTRYRELYAVSAPFIQPGASFESIMRKGAEAGQYPQAGADIEAFVTEMCAWHRGDHPPLERLLPDGRWLLVTERRTADGGTVGIRTDISDLKRANAELIEARDSAAAATRAKSLFLARMSHELRTPLNGVLGLAQALARDVGLPAQAREHAATLEAAGRHLVAVANDLLDLSRAEAGRLELHPSDFALPGLLRDTAAMMQPAAADRAVTLDVALTADLPAMVRADPTRLRQLVLNLLSNAVKFTPPDGRVSLRARRLDPTGAETWIRIEVGDTGPGVPEAARQAIFGDFVQVSAEHGGAGLGLAITARIVERMDGRIGCDSVGPGGGSLFWVELPLPIASPAMAVPATTVTAASPAFRVLVVDDVPSNLAVARALLGSAGHDVTCAPSGADALAAIEAKDPYEPFDVVLMDLMMPGMDGLEAARHIRAMPGRSGRLPILAVTASAFPEDIAACREAGMDGHLAKPIDRVALLQALEKLLSKPRVEDPPLLDDGTPRALAGTGLDAAGVQRLHDAFVGEVEDATAALRAAGADGRAVAAAAHRLAGAAATLGAARLAQEARRLESETRRPERGDSDALRRQAIETAGLTLTELRDGARAVA